MGFQNAKRGVILALLVLAGLGFASRCEAADAKAAADALFQPLIAENKCVGVSIGVIRGDAREYFGYGETGQHTDRVPDADTLFEIGSITKTFVGLMLAQMIDEGLVQLDAPIRTYLPEGTKVPAYGEREILVADLATHTSGLPRNPGGMWDMKNIRSLDDVFNPFAKYTPDRLYGFLAGYTLKYAPGTRFVYSNLGAGLLGHALSLKAGMPFEEMVVTRVCGPLGLNDTRVTLTPDQRGRVAPGYLQYAEAPYFANPFPSSYAPVPALGGAGSLRSTARDMLTYLAAHMGIVETPWPKAVAMTHEPQFTVNDRLQIGLFWHIYTLKGFDEPLYEHTGMTGGYYSYVGFFMKRQLGVAVLGNGIVDIDTQAAQLLRNLASAGETEP